MPHEPPPTEEAPSNVQANSQSMRLPPPISGLHKISPQDVVVMTEELGRLALATGRPLSQDRITVMVELLTARYDVAWIIWASQRLQFTFSGAYAQPLTVAHFVEVIEAQQEKQIKEAARARMKRGADSGFDKEGRMHSNEAAMGKLLYGGNKWRKR